MATAGDPFYTGDLTVIGRASTASNVTLVCDLADSGDPPQRVVYKPVRGEQPLWDFPENTLAYREVAAYLVSQSLGWDLVPPTVYRPEGPHGPGSLQFFVDAVPDWHYFNITDQERPAFQRVAGSPVP